MKKPVIGIVPLVDAGRDSLWMLPGYMDAIAQAGGLGVMLPLAEDGADIRRLLRGWNTHVSFRIHLALLRGISLYRCRNSCFNLT